MNRVSVIVYFPLSFPAATTARNFSFLLDSQEIAYPTVNISGNVLNFLMPAGKDAMSPFTLTWTIKGTPSVDSPQPSSRLLVYSTAVLATVAVAAIAGLLYFRGKSTGRESYRVLNNQSPDPSPRNPSGELT
jgi:hypothetical protein